MPKRKSYPVMGPDEREAAIRQFISQGVGYGIPEQMLVDMTAPLSSAGNFAGTMIPIRDGAGDLEEVQVSFRTQESGRQHVTKGRIVIAEEGTELALGSTHSYVLNRGPNDYSPKGCVAVWLAERNAARRGEQVDFIDDDGFTI